MNDKIEPSEEIQEPVTPAPPPGGFCRGCGGAVKAVGAICLKCGLPSAEPKEKKEKKSRRPQTVIHNNISQSSKQRVGGRNPYYHGNKSRLTACLLAMFLGGFGVHKFYLGQPIQGILYLVFCWTFIPAIIAFLEGICYLTFTSERFNHRYR